MNRLLKSFNILFQIKQPRLYFPAEKQVCVFNKRPIIYRGFTPNSVEDSIIELQKRLYAQGLLANVSGRFDSETEEAVKEFQKKNNLLVDGIVGPLSWACLIYPKLYRHQKNISLELQDAVKEVQNILYEEGFSQKKPDGYFDRETEKAVKRFQNIYGLKNDGIVGAATWSVLLGMRQKIDQSFPQLIYLLSPQSWFLWNQFLMISCILLGIYYSPLPGSEPTFSKALATAYGLTCIVPFLLDCLPLKQSKQPIFPVLQYAPYVLTGIFWKPILNFVGTLFN
ncbi:peptidoglycan-binding domain-containing protein [Anabaena catenula]|uniref:Peptidoglycan-binding protein n=1 Tax=Anabaena catenula FACHB-362 TaxID=2692877 RepID=A0ABR8JAV2_9NOST|nr:peptidoglycan-binding protein [Anabaena catenula]MBD2694653.1 peptidoglycan-binding protein [Anabaena catenula FACHB-362]